MTSLLLGCLLATAAHADAPDLVVVVAVDGLGAANLDRARPWLHAGLARLLEEGQVEGAASYAHLNAETGPGHASLATGAPPRVHGIVGNRWFVPTPEGGLRAQYCVAVDDPSGGEPVASAGTLVVDTLGDRLAAAHPDARVVSLSGKDRAALLLAGRTPTHAPYWYDKHAGTFVSSPAYPATGAWQQAVLRDVDLWNRIAGGPALVRRVGTTWAPLPEPADARDLPRPPADLLRFQNIDLGLGWDHDLSRHPRGIYEAYYASPAVDALVGELATTLLQDPAVGLGRGGAPDLLTLSFSAHDTVSHPFGSESAEELDALRRLDVVLGQLLATLDALHRSEGVDAVVALSADHGFSPIPEVVRRTAGAPVGGRLDWVDESWEHDPRTAAAFWSAPHPNTVERLDRAVGEALCLPRGTRTLAGIEGWSLTYAPWAAPVPTQGGKGCRRTVTHADVDRVLPDVVASLFGEEIEAVLPTAASRWPEVTAAPYARNATFRGRSGDAFLVPRPNVIMAFDPARGSSHGSHHPYDQHVPLIFWGSPFPATTHTTPSQPYDLAPTLADLLGLTLPDATGVSRLPKP